MIDDVLKAFGIAPAGESAEPLKSGLINHTWKIAAGGKQFILQRVNDKVFTNPELLAANLSMLSEHLKTVAPSYLFVTPLETVDGKIMYRHPQEGFFRMFPFIAGSHTIDVAASPGQAFEAAFQFGKFTKTLSGFDAGRLHATIPDFHNLELRYAHFETAVESGDPVRVREAADVIAAVRRHRGIVETFADIRKNDAIRKRVTHHDTKISNVLFNAAGKGICVIDLDTVMPGYFISDVGDMLRTYLSPANEEAVDFQSVVVREDFFRAVVAGYASAMQAELSQEERRIFLYAGFFLTYMQAIRFLTDFCNGDVYYGQRYEGHNLVRAKNQMCLLRELEAKKSDLEIIVSREFGSKR
ncbi:MAG TPA: aminoglycoside phosphotransferase family protein [Ohtaekwangia sp.]|nr:aminoglycoside phosphotransferase family protein [Ohtaekwangia sp.]